MKDCVYSSLREETLQLFGAVRTIAIGEVGAMLIIVSAMLDVKSPLGIAALLFTACGLLVFTTTLGQHWFLQALRQSSYLFFAYELPAFRENPERNLQDFWLLASRSESAYRRKTSAGEKGPHIHMGGDLERFIDQQLWLLCFAAIAACVVLVLRSSAPSPAGSVLWPTISAVVLTLATALCVYTS